MGLRQRRWREAERVRSLLFIFGGAGR